MQQTAGYQMNVKHALAMKDGRFKNDQITASSFIQNRGEVTIFYST